MQTEELDLIMERMCDTDADISRQALNMLFDVLKSSHTGSFDTCNFSTLNDKLSDLEGICERLSEDNRRYLYDLISVINVIGDDYRVIKYRIMGNVIPLSEWGRLYVKKLTNCIVDIKNGVIHLQMCYADVAKQCIDFLFLHNAEFEAINFLIELGSLNKLLEYLDRHNYERMYLYVRDMLAFYEFEDILLEMHKKMENWSRYLVTLISLNRKDEAIEFVRGVNNLCMKKQYLYILARCNIFYTISEDEICRVLKYTAGSDMEQGNGSVSQNSSVDQSGSVDQNVNQSFVANGSNESVGNKNESNISSVSNNNDLIYNQSNFVNNQEVLSKEGIYNELRSIIGNHHIKDVYKSVAKDLEVERPHKIDFLLRGFKHDKDIKLGAFVSVANAFIHFEYGNDGIMEQNPDQKAPYVYQGILGMEVPELISVMAGMGVINSWDPDRVIERLQEYLFGGPSFRKTGSLLGLGLSGLRLHDENYAILNLLLHNLETSETNIHLISTLLSIQSIYAGTRDLQVLEKLQPYLFHSSNDVSFFTAFVLGSVFLGSADEDLVSTLLQIFIERNKEAECQFFKFILLGIACLFYSRPDVDCDIVELEASMTRHAGVLVKGFQYVKSGNPAVIESILSESFTGETDALLESIGLLSCCLVSVGDELATQCVTVTLS